MNREKREYELLSAYIDGELSSEEVAQLEDRLKSSLDLQNKLETLRKTKQLVFSAYKKIPEAPYFEAKLSAKLKSPRPLKKSLLKWSPAIGLAVITIILMVFLKFNPGIIENLIEEQKSNIAGFYKENLQPLLFAADLNNEDIFNFAMYKQLPLDKENSQILHLGYDTSGREYFEIKYDNKQNENNFEKFIVSLDLNVLQRDQIDSILKRYAEELEGQVLVNQNNTVAINSNIWNYQRAIQTDLLAFAENSNKNEFYKFMPRTISLTGNPQVIQVANNLRTSKNKNYIILTPDSIFSEALEFDSEKFKLTLEKMEKELLESSEDLNEKSKILKEINVQIRYDSSWKKLKNHLNLQKDFHITLDSNLCRVELSKIHIPNIQIPDMDSLFESFDSIANNFKFYSKYIPRIEYFDDKMKFHFDSDSIKSYEFKYHDFRMDSLTDLHKELFDSIRNFNWNSLFRLNDSLAFNNFPGFDGYFDNFYDSGEIELEMNELKEELKKFRRDMKMWRDEFKENDRLNRKEEFNK